MEYASLEDRNLLGLIKGRTVCQGNAEIIRNLCAEYEIEATSVRGKIPEGAHEWNQVKLDGVWYDDDFTNYQYKLIKNKLNDCDTFLMGTDRGIAYTIREGYDSYEETNQVGLPFKKEDKVYLLNYGREKNNDLDK